jgi:hypothetical protein
MRGLRVIEVNSERAARELDIRRDLREWDLTFPQIHHELIVRYLCGAVASVGVTFIYNAITKPSNRKPDRSRY